MRRSSILSVVGGLALGVLVLHLVVGAAAGALVGALGSVKAYRGLAASARLAPSPLPDLVVVGSSLSAIDPRRPLLATALATVLQVEPSRVGNLAYPGRNVADVYAELLRARDFGVDSVAVELNPFIINDRDHRLGGGRPELAVVSEVERGPDVLLHVRGATQRRLVAQLGVEGALAGLASRWWPRRLGLPLYGGNPDSAVVGGLLPPVARALIGREPLPPVSADLPLDVAWRDWICPNFRQKSARGLDTDVIEDMMRDARRSGAAAVFFVPPMNRRGLSSRCGALAVAGLEALLGTLTGLSRATGARLCDLSHLLDDRPDVFGDYGHFVEPSSAAAEREARALLDCGGGALTRPGDAARAAPRAIP